MLLRRSEDLDPLCYRFLIQVAFPRIDRPLRRAAESNFPSAPFAYADPGAVANRGYLLETGAVILGAMRRNSGGPGSRTTRTRTAARAGAESRAAARRAAATPLFHMLAGAPKPVAPYSHAVEVDGWVFLTGQIPNDAIDDRAPLPEGIEAQTRQTMENLTRVLTGLGLGLEHVIAARVFLTRFDEDYQRMNRVYQGYFGAGRLPARTCIGVTALALGARIEIDFVARRA